ncbi:kinase-like domain-containing protein [Syncephalis plumigaleata]|nr:kinase-like domain-containing protein [Syncephalis plumigaleata]
MTAVKETTSAHYTETEDGTYKLNQYVIKEELGQGSFGVVRLAVDQRTGEEYAIKQFSKHRLRRRVREQQLRGARGRGTSLMMMRGRGRGRGRPILSGPPLMPTKDDASAEHQGHNPLMNAVSLASAGRTEEEEEEIDPLRLVRKEVAIYKKLSHKNVVRLFEVLDDPEHDTLFMVFEMCPGGTLMEITLNQKRDALPIDLARKYFGSLVLGIEYLHENDIVHRDIKPENLLLSQEGELKIADLGVSEMFEHGDDTMKRTAGSPAFMAPELVSVDRHVFSGKAADIWSMGVTLFCLCFGQLPFVGESILDVYSAIRETPLSIPEADADARLVHLLEGMMNKIPEDRMKMNEIRNHPWLTDDGKQSLIPHEENCQRVEVTEEDVRDAVRRIGSVITVIHAAQHWRRKTAAHRTSVAGISLTPSSPESSLSDDVKSMTTAASSSANTTPECSTEAALVDKVTKKTDAAQVIVESPEATMITTSPNDIALDKLTLSSSPSP